MKKYIVFLGLFSFLNTGIKAQGFNTLFFIDTCNTVVVSMKILNNYIYVGGYMADYTKYSNGIQSFVTKYDLNGNKISQVKLGDNKYWQWWLESNIEISSNNELLFSCTVRDTSSSTITSLLIVKMDSNLNIKNTFTFDTLGYTYLFGRSILIDKPNGNIYIAGHLQAPPQNANPFILKIDTSLKFKKFVILTNNVLTDVSSNIIIKNDTLLIAINADNMKYVTDPVCEISYKEHFAICDTNCNYISESLTSDTNISFSTSLIPVNTNYFTCGSYVTQRLCSKNHVNISSAIYKWDKDFKLIWKKYYGDTLDGFGLNKIKKAPNENAVLACGMKNVGDITANIYSWDWNGFFVKYDVNGNVLWNREYQGFKDTTRYQGIPFTTEVNNLIDFDFLPDGSIIACGNVEMNEPDSISQQGWLLRLRPDGCLNANDCGVNGLQEIKNKPDNIRLAITIYPNPSDENITISIDAFDTYPLKLNIFDVVGHKLKTIQLTENNQQVSCKDLPQGSYIAVFSQQQKVMGVSKFVKLK